MSNVSFSTKDVLKELQGHYESQMEKYLHNCHSDLERAETKGLLMGYKSAITLLKASINLEKPEKPKKRILWF